MKKIKVQKGSTPADKKYFINILDKGPYIVYGAPALTQGFIKTDDKRVSHSIADGEKYETREEGTALCRCGASVCKPYCDGSHADTNWNPELTADENPLLENARNFKGPEVTLSDNENYCAYARFCDAHGRVWNLVRKSDDEQSRERTVNMANMCPAGRLSAWDNKTGEPFEPEYDPSLMLLEDPAVNASGGLFVRGGIPVCRQDGFTYEIRNRAVLCRCGQSSNKPWCNGAHASVKFNDGLPPENPEDRETPYGM